MLQHLAIVLDAVIKSSYETSYITNLNEPSYIYLCLEINFVD
jgi:hypothetical protein